MKRFVDLPPGDDAENRAGELLRQAGAPPSFGANDQARVREALRKKLRRPRRRAWLFPTVAFGMAAVSLTLIAWLRFRLPSEAPVQIAVIGAGAAEVDPARPRHVLLRAGRLAVRTAEEGAVVDAPRAHVVIAPSSTVEIAVREAGLVVAAYVGEAQVEWEESRVVQRIAAGNELDASGTHAVAPARAREIDAALEGKPLPAPAPTPPPIVPAPAVAPPPAVEPAPVEPAKPVVARVTHAIAPRPAPVGEPEAVPEPEPAVPPPPPVAEVSPPPAPAPALPPATTTTTTTTPATATTTTPATTTTTPAVPAPAVVESELSKESRVLADAVRLLRRDRDAASALAALDEYRARWPKGALRPEADVARVDALLSLGRRADALAALEAVDLGGLPRARELGVVRGELRAEVGRCKEALRDFDGAARAGDALGERALWGRAGCRARLGDRDGARADLERYLARFPSGKFAEEARRALAQ